MSWSLVPLLTRDFSYFDRQRDLFPTWLHLFDDDWRVMRHDDAFQRFNRELDRIYDEMQERDESDTSQPPFVTDLEGNRKLSLKLDCKKFKPEEITVKTLDNTLHVHAKHVEDKPGRKVHREFTREFTLPKNVDPKKLESHLLQDGVLHIEAPAPAEDEAPKDFTIPIQHMQNKEAIEQKGADQGEKK